MYVLGLSAFYHDSAAALLCNGEIIAAAQEERFTRRKHDASFPEHALRYCLEQAGIRLRDVQSVAFYDKPFLKFERLLETYLAFAPRGFSSFRRAFPLWAREKLFLKELLRRRLGDIDADFPCEKRLVFSEHHLSHGASAFFPSPYAEAAVLTMDGVGEWATTSLAHGRDNRIEILREIHFPHSLGLLYSAFTYYTGFKVNSGEYKLMGLAPYGEAKYRDTILSHLIDVKEDGSFRLDMTYFNYCTGLTMTNAAFDALFGGPARLASEPLTQRHMDLAASIQAVTEEVVLKLTREIARTTGMKNLCLAGGVALNCVANGKILRAGTFQNIWIQPAAGDAGGALGAAYAAFHLRLGVVRIVPLGDAMHGAYLGPEFTQSEIQARLSACGATFEVLGDDTLYDRAVRDIVSGHAVGWFQGRMEFGPRALGNRSILGDPRSPTLQKTLNLKIKYRESFRPFAPAVLEEYAREWFDLSTPSPYMLIVADVAKQHQLDVAEAHAQLFGIDKLNVVRTTVPAVTHVDFSARVQTVTEQTNPRFHALLRRFYEHTSCPILVNTSFNVRGEPIVNSPEDAFRCFMGTQMDTLVIGNCFLRKEDQNRQLRVDYKDTLEPD